MADTSTQPLKKQQRARPAAHPFDRDLTTSFNIGQVGSLIKMGASGIFGQEWVRHPKLLPI
jgi:hypothetical protein